MQPTDITYLLTYLHNQSTKNSIVIIAVIVIIINKEVIVAFSHKNNKDTLQSKNTKPQTTSCLAVWKSR